MSKGKKPPIEARVDDEVINLNSLLRQAIKQGYVIRIEISQDGQLINSITLER